VKLILPIIVFILGLLIGSCAGVKVMHDYTLKRCKTESPRWYPYPQMCEYFVGDIKGRDE